MSNDERMTKSQARSILHSLLTAYYLHLAIVCLCPVGGLVAQSKSDISNPARRRNQGPIDVGTRKQLFIDDLFFRSSRGVELVVHSPVAAGVAIKADRPWEKGGLQSYHTIVPDPAAGHIKMYYMCFVREPGAQPEKRHILCYATSPDGIHWEKPNLGLIDFHGSKQNNIVMIAEPDSDQPTYNELGQVVIDPRDVPGRRYKMLYLAHPAAIMGAYSADGYRWTIGNDGKPITRAIADSQNMFLWDDSIDRWVGYFRYWNATRRVTRIETEEFWSWPFLYREDIVLAPDALDVYDKRLDGGFHRAGEVLDRREDKTRYSPDNPPDKFYWSTDNPDHLDGVDFYNQPVIKYPYAERAYVMPFSAFYHKPDLLEIQLAISRDGIHWDRPGDRQPWIRMPLADDDKTRRMYASPGVVRSGNQLYHYHTAIEQYHGASPPGEYEIEKMPDYIGQIRRTELRLDGYVSATAGNLEGGFVTPPIVHNGKRLELNVDTSASGYVEVELLDIYGSNPIGYQIKGYTRGECDRIISNSTRRTVTWNGNSDVSQLAGKSIRIHVRMRNARLYAFQFVE